MISSTPYHLIIFSLLATCVQSLDLQGGVSELNPGNAMTHFPWGGDNKNYIRGDTVLTGHLDASGSDVKVKRVTAAESICIGSVCLTGHQLERLLRNRI